MKTFVVADTHFNHENIIKYCNRPFDNTTQMNETIIKNWNEVVSKDDIVYHLGDFGFGSFEIIKEIYDKLNGKKHLIMGNHDYRYGKNFFLRVGFEEVEKKEIKIENIILSHYPKIVEDGYINIYGHIHDKPPSPDFDDDKHYCISLEKTNYYPVQIIEILQKIKKENVKI